MVAGQKKNMELLEPKVVKIHVKCHGRIDRKYYCMLESYELSELKQDIERHITLSHANISRQIRELDDAKADKIIAQEKPK